METTSINVKDYGSLKVPVDFREWTVERQQALIKTAVEAKEGVAETASDTAEQGLGVAGDILVSGGPSGFIGGKTPAPITEGEEDIPDWELPNVPLNYIRGAWRRL